jgi:hypothetical protein
MPSVRLCLPRVTCSSWMMLGGLTMPAPLLVGAPIATIAPFGLPSLAKRGGGGRQPGSISGLWSYLASSSRLRPSTPPGLSHLRASVVPRDMRDLEIECVGVRGNSTRSVVARWARLFQRSSKEPPTSSIRQGTDRGHRHALCGSGRGCVGVELEADRRRSQASEVQLDLEDPLLALLRNPEGAEPKVVSLAVDEGCPILERPALGASEAHEGLGAKAPGRRSPSSGTDLGPRPGVGSSALGDDT